MYTLPEEGPQCGCQGESVGSFQEAMEGKAQATHFLVGKQRRVTLTACNASRGRSTPYKVKLWCAWEKCSCQIRQKNSLKCVQDGIDVPSKKYMELGQTGLLLRQRSGFKKRQREKSCRNQKTCPPVDRQIQVGRDSNKTNKRQ